MNTLDNFIVKTKRKRDGEAETLGLPEVSVAVEQPTAKITSNFGSALDKSLDSKTSSVDDHDGKTEVKVAKWKETYPWISLVNNKVICTICTEAVISKLPLPQDPNSLASRQAFVSNGYQCFKNAYRAFPSHEKSQNHLSSYRLLKERETVNVAQQMSSDNEKKMKSNREAMKKIVHTVRLLAMQGLPLRGSDNDDRSNLRQILKARAEDVEVLNKWLERDGHKWLHHDIQNELLEMMYTRVLTENLNIIKAAPFFALMIDETADVSRIEQISVIIRVVSEDLSAKEIFIGFYKTANTKSKTLFNIVKEIFKRHGLDFKKIRGQCYDGAANVAGKISGLQSLIRAIENRALWVHCRAHQVSLSVQDGLQEVTAANNFIGTVKDLINFIRDSPKRVAEFQDIQRLCISEGEKTQALKAFCPTRWILRVSSLKTLHNRSNYKAALMYLDSMRQESDVDSVSSKARGFLREMESFEFYFLLVTIIQIFERIEVLNTELQKPDLCVMDGQRKVEEVICRLESSRDSKYEVIWEKATSEAKSLDIEEPRLPRQRNRPKRYETSSEAHVFNSPKDYYKKIYLEIYDRVVNSLKTRFDSKTRTFMNQCEAFAIGREADVDTIINFYGDDFDRECLIKGQEEFLATAARHQYPIHSLLDVTSFLKKNHWMKGLVKDYYRFVQLLMTIPNSTCTNERSFSTLKYLKNYMRSTMQQDRLNSLATLYVHNDQALKLDLESVLTDFIVKNNKRTATFAI